MTPDHAQLVEATLQSAYARTIEWHNNLAIPLGKNPPQYTHEMLWNCPLARDLSALVNYVEGYEVQKDITLVLMRLARALFGHTLEKQGYRLPRNFQKTALGELMYEAFARYFPPDAWMKTSEVVKLFGVKRQTVYDWAEEGQLAPYYVKGTQVFLRKDIMRYHERWLRKKHQAQQKGLVTQLGGAES
jgi:hypothetical protein